MFATIRRHQKWFWAGIIAVVIPSFVWFFMPTMQSPFATGYKGDFGSINGRPIPREEYVDAYRETQLFYFLNYNSWPEDRDDEGNRFGFKIGEEARVRVLLIQELKAHGIHPSDDATAEWIRSTFRDPRTKVFNLEAYSQFVRQCEAVKRISEADIERFAAHQVGIQALAATFGLNGALVTPAEAEASYRREHEQFDVQGAIFSSARFYTNAPINPTALSQFYTNHLSMYHNPERVQVSYVRFDLTNFAAEADQKLAKETNLEQRLDSIYRQQGPNYFTDTNGAPMTEAAAKAKIKEQLRRNLEMKDAMLKASEFATQLFDTQPQNATNLYTLAAKYKYQVHVSEPFDSYTGPKNLKVSDTFVKAAFALTPDNPFAPQNAGEDAVYVMAYNRRIPADYSPLDTIREKVAEDYRQTEAINAARRAAEEFYQKMTNEVARGKSFAAVCAEAKVSPVVIPRFSLSTRDLPGLDSRIDLGQLKELVTTETSPHASTFTRTRDGGVVLEVQGRQPADESEMKRAMPEYIKSLRQYRQNQAFNDWLSHAMTEARLAGPAQPKNAEKSVAD